jgi:hypothetical protein
MPPEVMRELSEVEYALLEQEASEITRLSEGLQAFVKHLDEDPFRAAREEAVTAAIDGRPVVVEAPKAAAKPQEDLLALLAWGDHAFLDDHKEDLGRIPGRTALGCSLVLSQAPHAAACPKFDLELNRVARLSW